jgi:hypothetical protein
MWDVGNVQKEMKIVKRGDMGVMGMYDKKLVHILLPAGRCP